MLATRQITMTTYVVILGEPHCFEDCDFNHAQPLLPSQYGTKETLH